MNKNYYIFEDFNIYNNFSFIDRMYIQEINGCSMNVIPYNKELIIIFSLGGNYSVLEFDIDYDCTYFFCYSNFSFFYDSEENDGVIYYEEI